MPGAAFKRPGDPVAIRRRFGLILFGAVFLVLFIVIAISEGLGDPDIPPGDIAVVEDVSGEAGTISKAEFMETVKDLEATYGGKEVPVEPGAQYTGVREWALIGLIEAAWVEGEVAERGITVSDEEVEEAIEKYKRDHYFESEAQLLESLKTQGFTLDAFVQQATDALIQGALEKQIREEAPSLSRSAVESYYEAMKGSQFTEQPSRDVRSIVNKDRRKIAEAQEALSEDSSAKNWSKIARKYSDEPTLVRRGGLVEDVVEGALEEPLGAAVYGAPAGQVEGPLKTERGFYLFEVTRLTPAKVLSLESVEDQIKDDLEMGVEREYSKTLQSNYYASWVPRTFCAPGHVLTYCANYEDDGHPATAPPACYEADPKDGRPEDCPAPVVPLSPAIPGSVTPYLPKGTALPQRPHPAGRNPVESFLPTQ